MAKRLSPEQRVAVEKLCDLTAEAAAAVKALNVAFEKVESLDVDFDCVSKNLQTRLRKSQESLGTQVDSITIVHGSLV